jgi:hypothetical protein
MTCRHDDETDRDGVMACMHTTREWLDGF